MPGDLSLRYQRIVTGEAWGMVPLDIEVHTRGELIHKILEAVDAGPYIQAWPVEIRTWHDVSIRAEVFQARTRVWKTELSMAFGVNDLLTRSD